MNPDPIQILRTALVAMLEDMAREAEARADLAWVRDEAGMPGYSTARNDADAIRRVIEIMGREEAR